MPEYRFIGDPGTGHGPSTIEFAGRTFSRDNWTPVEDSAVVVKLEGNSHFERRACDVEKPIDLSSGGMSLRDHLLAKAETLGIAVDGRWGVSRLQAEVDAAEAAHQTGGA